MSFDRVQFQQSSTEEQPESHNATPNHATSHLRSSQSGTLGISKSTDKKKASRGMMLGALLFVILAGIGSGFAMNFVTAQSGSATPVVAEQNKTAEEVENSIKVGTAFGVADEKTFSDSVEGVLIKGGISGEGSHTLLREGGVSQNVYLTSSVVDLDQFENMKVKVWGETFKGQKAGWLMDVGRLEVGQLDAPKPSWYQEQGE